MKKWKIAVVGCGEFAFSQYFPIMEKSPRCEVVAVHDILPERSKLAATKFKINAIYDSLGDLLAKSDCEIVINATPNPCHYEINRKVLQSGRHLFSQKPVGLTPKEVQNLIDTAKERNVRFAANPAQKLRPEVMMAKRMVEAGTIGKITKIYVRSFHGGAEYFQFRETDPTWFTGPGGGPLNDMAVHALCSATTILGPIKRIGAIASLCEPVRTVRSGAFHGMKIKADLMPDNYVVYVDFGDGIIGTIDTGFCQKESRMPNIEVYGTMGTISMKPAYSPWPMLEVYIDCPERGVRGWLNPMELEKIPDKTFHNSWVIFDLIDAIENNREPTLDARQALHIMDAIACINESVSRNGVLVEVKTTF
jgi:UDP-N-acetyl-2-amino-2-deoxyglucuronate dehydrogenase